ncbi:MAG: hypothetical protein U0234_17670 [Sandaracinus sp.]
MRPASTLLRSLVAASLASVLASCAQATQIILVVDSDLDLSRVDVDVSSTHSPPSHATAEIGMPSAPSLPLTLALYPRSSADIDVVVTVVGTLEGGGTVERDVTTRFVSGSSRMLLVLLAARCVGRICEAGQTCDETGCRDIAIPGGSLPSWSGSAPSLSGMAACASAPEECNYEDDDCDMSVDEAFDLATDPQNCGFCGHDCGGAACAGGLCAGEEAVAVSAGGAHTCSVSSQGNVSCWGWNEQRQLAQVQYSAYGSPRVVEGLDHVSEIAAGSLHTCTVDESGRVECFGEGAHGELGRGDSIDRSMPAPIASAATFERAFAGVAVSCGLTTTGALVCWGANDRGQLGNGSTAPASMPSATVLDQVVDASVGFQHACAVRSDGSVWCWGSSDDGQCGPHTSMGVGVPVPVDGITDATHVACGRAFTCVLHMGGTVSCFGRNDHGQLGSGSAGTGSITPVPVATLDSVSAIAVASGGTHACALRTSGLVACWGGNTSGQLGDGTQVDRPAPVMVPQPTDATAITAGGLSDDGAGHTCAIDGAGRVWCWGDGALGQVGAGDYLSHTAPTLVTGAL